MLSRTIPTAWGSWAVGLSQQTRGQLLLALGDADGARAAFEESAECFRAIQDRIFLPPSLHRLAALALRDGDHGRARALLEEGVAAYRATGVKLGAAYNLEGFAAAATLRGEARLAVVLWAAAAAIRNEHGLPVLPSDRAYNDGLLARARSGLDERSFAAAWSEGLAMGLEPAMRLAIGGQ